MTERMHPADLRAIVAAIAFIHPAENGTQTAVSEADALLAELERTAKPEPQPASPAIISSLEARLALAEERAEKAEDERDKAKRLMDIAHQAIRDIAAIVPRLRPDEMSYRITERVREMRDHLAAIKEGREGEPPMPEPGDAGPDHQHFEALKAWGRQGWDAAASLRLDAARVDWLEKAIPGGIVTLSPELDGGAGAILARPGDSPVYIRERNTVRDILDTFRANHPNP